MAGSGLLDGVALVDHHGHGVANAGLDRQRFELLATEAGTPAPPGCTGFDTQVGCAIRRWCAPTACPNWWPPGQVTTRPGPLQGPPSTLLR